MLVFTEAVQLTEQERTGRAPVGQLPVAVRWQLAGLLNGGRLVKHMQPVDIGKECLYGYV